MDDQPPTEKERAISVAMAAMREGHTPAAACYIGWGLITPTLVAEVLQCWDDAKPATAQP